MTASPGTETRLRSVATDELDASAVDALRRLVFSAFDGHNEPFDEEDWQHALGGRHFILEIGAELVAHAAVVEREIHIGSRPLRTGYVEAVAVDPALQGRRLGTRLMRAVNAYLDGEFELGALGSDSFRFYEQVGWQVWQGPTFVRTDGGKEPTPEGDGYILVHLTPRTPELDFTEPISCEWRSGDVW